MNGDEGRVEVSLIFKDDPNPIVLTDKEVIRRMGTIVRAISSETADWETKGLVVPTPLPVPFLRKWGEFLVEHIKEYQSVRSMPVRPSAERDFIHAYEKPLEELKNIVELADFLECSDFVDVISFVIAKKLHVLEVTDVAAFMGVPVDETRRNDPDLAWINPPMERY